jgi:hypothetical protein
MLADSAALRLKRKKPAQQHSYSSERANHKAECSLAMCSPGAMNKTALRCLLTCPSTQARIWRLCCAQSQESHERLTMLIVNRAHETPAGSMHKGRMPQCWIACSLTRWTGLTWVRTACIVCIAQQRHQAVCMLDKTLTNVLRQSNMHYVQTLQLSVQGPKSVI